MPHRLEFFYDLVSPYSYLAHTQLAGLARRTGAEVVYRPFLLGGVFKEAGNATPLNIANKAPWLARDCQLWAEHYGVPFAFPTTFPVNTLKAMRGAIVAERAGKLLDYSDRGFRALFSEGQNLSDVGVLARIAGEAGLDPGAFPAAIEDPSVKEELMAAGREAVARGAFGAPTFFVDGSDLFWGNDRLLFVEKALAR